ncbi:MAG: hypothetical protein ACFFD4_27600 [Candidatus Odinarchaeota archaeon]
MFNQYWKSLQARLISLSHQPLVLADDGATLRGNARVLTRKPVVTGTPGCSTSSGLCGQWLNSSEGKEQCCWQLQETPCNIDDVDHSPVRGRQVDCLSLHLRWRKKQI